MERNADATRRRIIAAASEEFAEHGLAGGRVDRIAERAEANKAQIYHYFGSKEALFDRVFDAFVEANLAAVPLRVEDFADWVVDIADYYLREPDLIRLGTWARLERTPHGDLYARHGGISPEVLDRVADGQRSGALVDDVAPVDLFCMAVALAGTWAQASINITATADDPPEVRERRRRALRRTAAAAFTTERLQEQNRLRAADPADRAARTEEGS
ncbi:TetR/AcrR family transcriptional regulator [Amnibacterium setariae]|uniref:TetR/AcrR family transcriptional regulator n=1 Tax=Amnibacterium setariae TaxID=2306585 RepID=A0A3A1TXT3_9MICO|nr:TetR family transcriptional regulator [Amnibacterium setariae]RIX28629.1 TetR/AcrR family transcriptional regulator [Amnibacterium setariae]